MSWQSRAIGRSRSSGCAIASKRGCPVTWGGASDSLAASMRKPATLVYGVEEAPPRMVTVVSAIQHVGVIAIFMVYPLIIGRQAGAPAEELSNILRMAMLVLACAVVLQA